MATTQPGKDATPGGEMLARSIGAQLYQTDADNNLVAMSPGALAIAGGGERHNNLMPYLTLNFCIALQGVYPPRQ